MDEKKVKEKQKEKEKNQGVDFSDRFFLMVYQTMKNRNENTMTIAVAPRVHSSSIDAIPYSATCWPKYNVESVHDAAQLKIIIEKGHVVQTLLPKEKQTKPSSLDQYVKLLIYEVFDYHFMGWRKEQQTVVKKEDDPLQALVAALSSVSVSTVEITL